MIEKWHDYSKGPTYADKVSAARVGVEFAPAAESRRSGESSVNVYLHGTRIADSDIMPPIKYWEIIADKLSAAG